MPRKKQKPPNIEIQPDMKVLLELEQSSETDGFDIQLSLYSHVEEVMPDGYFLIKMPIHRGNYYPLPKYKPFLLYLFVQFRMFSLTVRFVERVKRDNLVYAKIQPVSKIKPDQRRDCYRLECSLPVIIKPLGTDNKQESPLQGKILNFSDGGLAFATNETFEIGETLTLTFEIGTTETVEAKVLVLEKADIEGYRHRVSTRFVHTCKSQKERFYKYIVAQQNEILRKVGTDSELL